MCLGSLLAAHFPEIAPFTRPSAKVGSGVSCVKSCECDPNRIRHVHRLREPKLQSSFAIVIVSERVRVGYLSADMM